MKNCIYDFSKKGIWESKLDKLSIYDRRWTKDSPCSCCSGRHAETFNLVWKRVCHIGLPGISKTCTTLYRETAMLPFKHYVFYFEQAQDFIDFCDCTFKEQRSQINELCLCMAYVHVRSYSSPCCMPIGRPTAESSQALTIGHPKAEWSQALMTERLKDFRGLKSLTVHMYFRGKLVRFEDLEEHEISQLAGGHSDISALMRFRSLDLRSVTIVLGGNEEPRDEEHWDEEPSTIRHHVYIPFLPNCSRDELSTTAYEQEWLRRIILGPDKVQGIEPNQD